jgi:hypothetical protein
MRSQAKWLAVALAPVVLAAGCLKTSTSSGGDDSSEGNVAGHVQRGKDLQKIRNDLGQLAKLYQTYSIDVGRPPADQEAFIKYIQRDARHIAQDIQDGKYVVIWGVQSLSSNTVLAYEKDVDLRGNQVVVMGDATVSSMTPQQLQAALQK